MHLGFVIPLTIDEMTIERRPLAQVISQVLRNEAFAMITIGGIYELNETTIFEQNG